MIYARRRGGSATAAPAAAAALESTSEPRRERASDLRRGQGAGGGGQGGQGRGDGGRGGQRNGQPNSVELQNFWDTELSENAAVLSKLTNKFIAISPPAAVFINSKYTYDRLLGQLEEAVPCLYKNWINKIFPDELRSSAIIHIAFEKRSDGVELAFELRLSVEQMRYIIESSSAQPEHIAAVAAQLSDKLTKDWYVPTFRRFAREFFELPREFNDPPLLLIPAKKRHEIKGFLIPENGDISSERVLDLSYYTNYLYFTKKHNQWNQVFVPEYVCESPDGTKPIYRLKIEVEDTFDYKSSKKTLYLEISEFSSFIAGNAQNVRMTCDVNRASCFVIRRNSSADKRAIRLDNLNVLEGGTYMLHSCTLSGCEYPIYSGRSEIFHSETRCLGAKPGIHELIKLQREAKAKNSTLTDPLQAVRDGDHSNVTTQEAKSSIQSPSNVFRTAIAASEPTESDPDLQYFLSEEGKANHLLFHPISLVVGIRALSLSEAFQLAVRIHRYLTTSSTGQVEFAVYMRHGASSDSAMAYGIGCTSSGTPTFLNEALIYCDDDLIRQWSSVMIQIELDVKSFLFLRSPKDRLAWLNRAFRESMPKDIVKDNRDHQEAMAAELLAQINQLCSKPDALLQDDHPSKILRRLEEEILKSKQVRSFEDLHMRQSSFLEFVTDHEAEFPEVLKVSKVGVSSQQDAYIDKVRHAGARFLEGRRDSDPTIPADEYLLRNLLTYFDASDVTELGYSSAQVLYDAVVHRSKSKDSSNVRPLRGSSFGEHDLSMMASQVDALAALRDCPVLANLYEGARWSLLFEHDFGSIGGFLSEHSDTVGFVEISRNNFIRLPDIDAIGMGSKKEAYLSILRSNWWTESSHRSFMGAIVGLWVEHVPRSEIISAISKAFDVYSSYDSAVVVFETFIRCVELIPKEILLDIGALLTDGAMSQVFLAQLEDVDLPVMTTSTQLLLRYIAQITTNAHLETILRGSPRHHQSPFRSSNDEELEAVFTGLQLDGQSDSLATINDDLFRAEEVNAITESVGEVVDRSTELFAICDELASKRALKLAAERDRYIVSPGSEGLQDIAHKTLKILAQQLYSHQGRSMFELIQNADDCQYAGDFRPSLKISLSASDRVLRLAYNEQGFETADIYAISMVSGSTKVNSLSQGGKKGIGFKSVFMISEEPEVHSNGFHFKFNEHGAMGYLSPIPMATSNVAAEILKLASKHTVLSLPLRRTMMQAPESIYDEPESSQARCTDGEVQVKVYKQLKGELSVMNPDVLLFLRRLREMEVSFIDAATPTSPESVYVKLIRMDNGNMRCIREVKNSKMLDRIWILGEECSKPLLVRENPVQVAIPLHDDATSEVTALLPIRSYGLSFALNGPFQLTANRENIIKPCDSEFNRKLILKVPSVFSRAVENVLEFAKHQSAKSSVFKCCAAIINAVPDMRVVAPEFQEVAPIIVELSRDKVCCVPCVQPAIDPSLLSNLVQHLGEICVTYPKLAVQLPAEWKDHFDMSDLALALCSSAQGMTAKFLVHPEFSIRPAALKTLQIKTIDVEMLKSAMIELWNNWVLKSHSTSHNVGEVFSRLLKSFFKVLSPFNQRKIMDEISSSLKMLVLPNHEFTVMRTANASFIPSVDLDLMDRFGWNRSEFIAISKSAFSKNIIDPSISILIEADILTEKMSTLCPHPRHIIEILNSWRDKSEQQVSVKQAQIQFIAFVMKWAHVLTAATITSNDGNTYSHDADRYIAQIVAEVEAILCNPQYLRLINEAIEVNFTELLLENSPLVKELHAIILRKIEEFMNDVESVAESDISEDVALKLQDTTPKDNYATQLSHDTGRTGELFMTRKLNELYPEKDGFRVHWENEFEESGLPYDITISSLQSSGETVVAHVEVKSTVCSKSDSKSKLFEISISECFKMGCDESKYWIARVYGVNGAESHIEYDIIRNPFHLLHDHSWKLVCKMSAEDEVPR